MIELLKMKKRAGQNTIEYVMVVSVVIIALASMVNMLSRMCSSRLGVIQDYVAEREEAH